MIIRQSTKVIGSQRGQLIRTGDVYRQAIYCERYFKKFLLVRSDVNRRGSKIQAGLPPLNIKALLLERLILEARG